MIVVQRAAASRYQHGYVFVPPAKGMMPRIEIARSRVAGYCDAPVELLFVPRRRTEPPANRHQRRGPLYSGPFADAP